jgi:hypothetical protein
MLVPTTTLTEVFKTKDFEQYVAFKGDTIKIPEAKG